MGSENTKGGSSAPGILSGIIGTCIIATSGVGPVSAGLLFFSAIWCALLYFNRRAFNVVADDLHEAAQALGRGEGERAEAILEARENAGGWGPYRRTACTTRAFLALERGNAKLARELADAGATAKLPWLALLFDPAADPRSRTVLRCIRALSSALLGDADDATRDANSSLSCAHASEGDVARARLALAIVAKHNGETATVQRVLREQKRIMYCLLPSERRIARGLLRAASQGTPSVYRQHTPLVEAAEAQAANVWLDRIAPGISDALPCAPSKQVTDGQFASLNPFSGLDEARARALAEPKPIKPVAPKKRAGWHKLLVAFGLVALITLVLFLRDRYFGTDGSTGIEVAASTPSLFWRSIPGLIPGFLLMAFIVWTARKTIATRNGLARASCLFFGASKDNEALAVLAPYETTRGSAAIEAAILRSQFLATKSLFGQALRATEQGIVLSRTAGANADDASMQDLLGRGALLHVALHRAEPTGDHLERAYGSLLELRSAKRPNPSLPSFEFRVALFLALAQGDETRAADLAKTRPATLSLSYVDDLVCEALALLSATDTPVAHKTALAAEIGSDRECALRFDTLAPGLRERLAGRALTQSPAALDDDGAYVEPDGHAKSVLSP